METCLNATVFMSLGCGAPSSATRAINRSIFLSMHKPGAPKHIQTWNSHYIDCKGNTLG